MHPKKRSLRRNPARHRPVSSNPLAFGLIGPFFSPTRFLIELQLSRPRTSSDRATNARTLKRWNLGWSFFELGLLVAMLVISTSNASMGWKNVWYFYVPICVVAASRINEVAYAFFKDALSRLGGEQPKSSLTPLDRVKLLMRSYFGLWVNFALLYYLLPLKPSFKKPLENFADALYFSGATLTAIGQEGQELCNYVFKFLSLYQVLCGLLLLVVAISIYIGAAGRDA